MALARYELTVQDEAGNVIPSASVEVRRERDGAIVSLYSDRNGATPIGNPMTGDSDGRAGFHVVGGAYQITASKDGFSYLRRYVGIGLAQETDQLTSGVTFSFSTTTTDADPGSGNIRFNNATLGSVTTIYVDNVSAQGATISSWLNTFDDRGTSLNRGFLYLMTADATGLMIAQVTGSVVDGTGYRKISVTPVTTAGTFANGVEVNMTFVASSADGANGTDGITPGMPFTFSTTTSMADPGTGALRFNNATLSSVTAAAVDDASAATGNPDVSTWVLSWDDSTQTSNRGHLIFKNIAAPQNFAIYRITGASTDNSGWTQLALTYVTHAGSFSNGITLSVEFVRAADNYVLATASETVEGGVEMATNAEIRSAATGAKAIMAEDLETAAAFVALTETAGAVAVDWDTFVNGEVTVDEATVISNPTNGQPGTVRQIYIIGNNATPRVITFGNQFLGEVPTIIDVTSTKAYLLSIFCKTSTHFIVNSKRALG
jgi:hypothetical protein